MTGDCPRCEDMRRQLNALHGAVTALRTASERRLTDQAAEWQQGLGSRRREAARAPIPPLRIFEDAA